MGKTLRICRLRQRERERISRRLAVVLAKGHLLVTETNRTGYVVRGGGAGGGPSRVSFS